MRLPVVHGLIDRRILVNYRVDPDVLARILPSPFRPKQVSGYGIAGICLIRLRQIRPRFFPGTLGFDSENAAHRIAVDWTENGRVREGVYVPRRDTSSRFNALVGGRVFPGQHHHAHFEVEEREDFLRVALASEDGQTRVAVQARPTDQLPESSVFDSLEEASAFFERGSVGYSAARQPGRYDGLELVTRNWSVRPLAVETVESSYFSNRLLFPAGSVTFDCALLMRSIEHEWHGLESLQSQTAVPAAVDIQTM